MIIIIGIVLIVVISVVVAFLLLWLRIVRAMDGSD